MSSTSYMSPNVGGAGELRGLSQWIQLYTGAQTNSIFKLWSPVLTKTFLGRGLTARFRLLRWRKKRRGSRRRRPACWWRWPPHPPSRRPPAPPGYPRLPAWHNSPDTDFIIVAGADPYVFRPPGPGSISQRYASRSESFYHQSLYDVTPVLRFRIRIRIRRIRMFLGSWIRIHKSEELRIRIRIRIFLSSSKNSKKEPWLLLYCDFFMTFYLWKIMM
jgi:hypothetical protein